MADTATRMQDNLQSMGKTVENAASNAATSVRDAAGVVGERVRGAASNVSKSAEAAAGYLGERAEDATAAFGTGLKSAGDAIRQNAPQSGRLAQASDAIAQSFIDSGNYVEEQGLEGMANDVATLIRRNPIPALLIGIGLAVWITRSMQSRR